MLLVIKLNIVSNTLIRVLLTYAIMLPAYEYNITCLLFLVFCGLIIDLLISTCFYCSVVFLLLYRYLLDFIALSSFYFLLAIRLFSLLCSLFIAKLLGQS